ncbi:uncharacterized protein RCC_09694 [Ramularia collo-cygni]|uniref:BTB domain-containing protein n=1 Tax=Ramularia collo-cygni TaxID=112498 RepID=A0A2D3VPQ8_9PEZI|nr:uncharacterized protein RCC_09694 [Ramularia collo-cygni]CZT23978.1 uncharacterized protein RCC_09694 [Ramularia collo-cygni]
MADLNEAEALVRRQGLFNSPIMSDIQVLIGDYKFFAHKAILSLASQYFERRLHENDNEENAEPIRLTEPHGRDAAHLLLRHVYGFEVEILQEGSTGDWLGLARPISLLDVAGRYQVSSLRKLTEDKFTALLECISIATLVTGMESIYLYFPAGDHRRIAVKVCLDRFESFMGYRWVQPLFEKCPELVTDLLESALGQDRAIDRLKQILGKPELAVDILKGLARLGAGAPRRLE